MRARIAAAIAAAMLLGAACSSNESGGSSSSSSSSSGAGGGDPTPAESCVRPGDKGNSKGVGEYCSPFGGQCTGFPGAPLCLADVGQTQWMCTRIGCNAMTDCGEGAGCLIEPDGSACVPCRCDDRGIGCTDGGTPGTGGAGGTGGTGGAGGMGGAGGGMGGAGGGMGGAGAGP